MRKAIVSGADGFVGSYTVKNLLENGYKVLALVRKEPKRLEPHENLELLYIDTKDIKDSLPKDNYDYFFHFAWSGSSGELRSDYLHQMENVYQSIDALEEAKRVGCKRFIGAGSIMEIESRKSVESASETPSPYFYGVAKYIAHTLLKMKAAEIGIELVWPMITNAYGPLESSPRFINTTIRKSLNKEGLSFSSGVQNYDFLYVEDVAEAFRLVAERGVNYRSYLLGSGEAAPLKKFINRMLSTIHNESEVSFGTEPFNGVRLDLHTFSINDLVEDTGFSPKFSFEEGIRKTKEWIESESY